MLTHRFSVWCVGLVLLSQTAWGQGFSPDESVRRMKVPAGFQVQLVASEPQIRQPIFVKFDDRGRLWTIQYLQYPNPAGLKRVKVDRWSRTVYDRVPEPPPKGPQGADKISVLIDHNHDGRADEVKDVITGLNLCTGLEFGHGGMFVLQVPYLLFYPDKNHDDVIDGDPEVLLTGFGMEDAQSFANHLTWGPDGWLYGVNGSTTTCQIRGLEFQQGVWRYHPVTREFELFCEGGGNLFGLTFDAEGNLIYTGNGGYLAFHALQGAYYLKTFGKHGPLHNPHAYGYFNDIKKDQAVPGAPSTGGTIYLSGQPRTQLAVDNREPIRPTFPAAFNGSLISGNFLGHSLSWWKLAPLGATFSAQHQGLLVDSQDTWSCPTDVCLGPDGAIYWSDFYDQRTAHPDPDAQWDLSNGRIYRIIAEGMTPPKPVNLRALNDTDLLTQLDLPGWYADRARMIIAERTTDSSLYRRLQIRLREEKDPARMLQYLWTLHQMGFPPGEPPHYLLDHPAASVRRWAVRLFGDRQPPLSPDTGAHLVRLAQREDDITVRCQLAATAKRHPDICVSILTALLDHTPEQVDPYLSLMIWWGLESQALVQRHGILNDLVQPVKSRHAAVQFQVEKLIRRYASEGSREGYDTCVALIQKVEWPAEFSARLIAALRQGLSERSTAQIDIGQGDFLSQFAESKSAAAANVPKPAAAVAGPLLDLIAERFRQPSHSLDVDYLAMLSDNAELKAEFLKLLQSGDRSQLLPRLSILETYGESDCVPLILPLLDSDLRLKALHILARFDQPEIVARVLAGYPAFNSEEKRAARDLCLRRPAGTLALLKLVDDQKIPSTELAFDQLRLVALHGDPQLDALVRKHWGNVQPGTSEEKLATVRRYKNDLRAAAGNASAGKVLFTKHCATCHKLFQEGGTVGPDLNPANRGDRDYLLVSIVDPSAVIRSQFLNYVVTTQSGGVLQGVLAEQDAASITLVDAKGQRHAVPRTEIDELQESTVSLMPERLLEPLSPQELRDLFAYLQQIAPPKP